MQTNKRGLYISDYLRSSFNWNQVPRKAPIHFKNYNPLFWFFSQQYFVMP
ncbi:hypothetical protein S83_006627 [Arachis hypogaea]